MERARPAGAASAAAARAGGRAAATRRAVVGMLTGCVQRRVLPRRQRRDRAGAGAGGLRRRHPARPGLLRRAERAQRPRGGGAGVRPPHGRHVRGGRGRARRGQRGRLRLVDEGVRRAAAPTTRRTPTGGRRSPPRCATSPRCSPSSGRSPTRHPLPVTVAYHDACHLAHAQGVRTQPRDAAARHPRARAARDRRRSICCGSAGIYNLLNPEAGRRARRPQGRDVLATGAELLVTANPGCLMQVAAAVAAAGPPDRAGPHRRGAGRLAARPDRRADDPRPRAGSKRRSLIVAEVGFTRRGPGQSGGGARLARRPPRPGGRPPCARPHRDRSVSYRSRGRLRRWPASSCAAPPVPSTTARSSTTPC